MLETEPEILTRKRFAVGSRYLAVPHQPNGMRNKRQNTTSYYSLKNYVKCVWPWQSEDIFIVDIKQLLLFVDYICLKNYEWNEWNEWNEQLSYIL